MAAPLDLVAQRRVLQLETLYDLLVALHGHQSEEELVEDLLERVCAVLDPAAAAVVTRAAHGKARAAASVGWPGRRPDAAALLADPVWLELQAQGRPLERRDGTFARRDFQHLLVAPLQYRSVFQGYLAVLDKERRDGKGACKCSGGREPGPRRPPTPHTVPEGGRESVPNLPRKAGGHEKLAQEGR